MHNETHRALLRYNIFAFFRSLLDPKDTERICRFDLEALTLTLLDD
jgi:hypothetical protein